MFGHFFKVLLRTSGRKKSYTFLNVAGLSLGMMAFVFIFLYAWNERSYDDFHAKKDRIFRLRQDRYSGTELTRQWTAGPWGIGQELKSKLPEVIRYVSVNNGGMRSTVLSNKDIFFREERVFYASEDFFKVFSYPLIKGIDSLVLREPFTMVVSESLAKRYFGETDPIGQTLKNNGKEEYVITGVFKDVPENTHLKFDALFSFESMWRILGPKDTQELLSNWGWSGNYTYIELAPTTDAKTFEAKIPEVVEKKMGEYLKTWGEKMTFVLQPVTSIHLYSNFKDEIEMNGDGRAVDFLLIIGVFILAMAWINYINLSTARSIERAREVGVRKVLGSYRSQLITQFLFESFVFKFTAMVITALAVAFLLPHFSTFLGKVIEVPDYRSPNLWLFIIGVLVVGVLISGLYPALVLSGFRPVSILKGGFQDGKGNLFRKCLVAVQFTAFVLLIVGTFTVHRQLKFMESQALGIDTEQMLVMQGPHITDSTYASHYDAFRNEMMALPNINNVTVSSDVPGRTVRASNGGIRIVGQDAKAGNAYRVVMSDENFVETYKMNLIAGRTFVPELHDHWRTALVNETAMRLLGFMEPEKIIGQKIYVWSSEVEIVGVLKDYHQESLKKKVDQIIFLCDKDVRDYFTVKIRLSGSVSNVVEEAVETYKSFFPGNPVHYFFLDDYFDQQYQSERQFSKVFKLFTLLAVVIACLGLAGLTSYTTLRRTREIGIRKVFGASVGQIIILLTRELIAVVLLANVIAIPVALLVMKDWLSGFAYRINMSILLFTLPAITAVVIAVLSVASQSFRAAAANPIRSLRQN